VLTGRGSIMAVTLMADMTVAQDDSKDRGATSLAP
jgi:hypothetical protein